MINIKSGNPNYLCKVVRLEGVKKHPNADRLQTAVVDFQTIITGLNAKDGDLYVYFPIESKINLEFLKFTNSFSNAEENKDPKQKGFFGKHGRVRATRLREIVSEGYVVPVSSINNWLTEASIYFQLSEDDLDKSFDSFGDVVFCEKYIPLNQKGPSNQGPKSGKVKKESKLVENQVRLHVDTKHLKREIGNIAPEDWIEVCSKWHGSNASISRLLVKKKLNLIDKLAKFFGANIISTEYDLLYTSRRVIKSTMYVDEICDGYYNSNIWKIVAEKYKDCLKDGITCFGELVGFTPSGGGIQGLFDYGCAPNECDFYVFRVTYTSPVGDVYEFSLNQVTEYCEKHGLKHVPVYFVGRAKDMYPELDTEIHWRENFIKKLSDQFLEKECIYCVNKVPAEGIVVSRRSFDGYEAYKLKSLNFLIAEGVQLDKGEGCLEDGNS